MQQATTQPKKQQAEPQPAPPQDHQNEEDMIGAIKIKDGLFIGDEFAAQVSLFGN